MARIRSIKPEFWSSAKCARVSRDARLLFLGTWNEADDEGRLLAGSKRLAGIVFPHDEDVGPAEVRRWRDELVRAGLVVVYVVAGVEYAWIPGFGEHQKIDKRSPSRLPPPPEGPAPSPPPPPDGPAGPPDQSAEPPEEPAAPAAPPASDRIRDLGSEFGSENGSRIGEQGALGAYAPRGAAAPLRVLPHRPRRAHGHNDAVGYPWPKDVDAALATPYDGTTLGAALAKRFDGFPKTGVDSLRANVTTVLANFETRESGRPVWPHPAIGYLVEKLGELHTKYLREQTARARAAGAGAAPAATASDTTFDRARADWRALKDRVESNGTGQKFPKFDEWFAEVEGVYRMGRSALSLYEADDDGVMHMTAPAAGGTS